MKIGRKTVSIIATLLIVGAFLFMLYKSCMSIEQMTDIFDNTRGIGDNLAPKIATDIHQKYFLFDKNIFLLIGGFIATLIFSQFMIMKNLFDGQVENFELHQGTKLSLNNQINNTKREINQNIKDLGDLDVF